MEKKTKSENKKEKFNKKDKYYHVWTIEHGIKLYAKEDVELCCCNGSLHLKGLGCF